jgi:hypothetical protein
MTLPAYSHARRRRARHRAGRPATSAPRGALGPGGLQHLGEGPQSGAEPADGDARLVDRPRVLAQADGRLVAEQPQDSCGEIQPQQLLDRRVRGKCPQSELGLPKDLLWSPTVGPAAGVGALGVVVAEIPLKVEAEPVCLGMR